MIIDDTTSKFVHPKVYMYMYSYKTLLVLHKALCQSSSCICWEVTTLWANLQHCLDQSGGSRSIELSALICKRHPGFLSQ